MNPPKRAKQLNGCYYPIIHGCINNILGRESFKNFRILLESGCSSTISMRRLVEKTRLEKRAVIQWNTQAGNITINIKIKLYFTLPTIRATNVVTWKCHVDDPSKGRYDMILGQYLLT